MTMKRVRRSTSPLMKVILAICGVLCLAGPARADAAGNQAKALAVQARILASNPSASIANLGPNSVVAACDSLTANSNRYDLALNTSVSNTWQPKAIFAQLLALSAGALRPVEGIGWPINSTYQSGQFETVLIARGGQNYSANSTVAFSATGGTPPTATLQIANGVITSVTLTSFGSSNSTSGVVTITDPNSTGSGAVLVPILAGSGEFATGGLDSIQASAFVPYIIASGAKNVIWLCGTNNLNGTNNGVQWTQAQTQAQTVIDLNALVKAGIRPFVIAPLDRAEVNGSASRQFVMELRRWMVDQLPALVPGVVVVDPTPYATDPTLDTSGSGHDGLPVAWTSDGLHCNTLGCFQLAQTIWNQIKPYFSAPYMTSVSAYRDYYSASTMPTGNLLATGSVEYDAALMTGGAPTAVTGAETPWTGTRPAGVYLTRTSNCTGTGTAVASQASHPAGRFGTGLNLAVNVTGETSGCRYRLIWFKFGSSAVSTPTWGIQGGNTLQLGMVLRGTLDELTLGPVSGSGQTATVGLQGYAFTLRGSNSSTVTPTASIPINTYNAASWGDFQDTSGFPAYTGQTVYVPTRQFFVNNAAQFYAEAYFDFICGAGTCEFNAFMFGASVRRTDIAP